MRLQRQVPAAAYLTSIVHYTGNILLAGISYDKKHECRIEAYEKME